MDIDENGKDKINKNDVENYENMDRILSLNIN